MLPKTESWMTPDEKTFRQQFPLFIDQINKQHLLPFTIIEQKPFDTGNTSIATLLNPESEKVVLKTASNPSNIINEAIVLNHWSQVVRTPKIFLTHTPETSFPYAFFTSEYIFDPMLEKIDIQERISNGISFQLGSTLAKIHSQPQINLTDPSIIDINKITTETNKRLLMHSDQSIIQKAKKSLEIISLSPFPLVICHMDFLPANLFYGDNLTVFDPTVAITHPFHDLARTLLITEVSDQEVGQIESQEILKGYQSISSVDIKLINAFKVINALRKIDRWTIKGNSKKVQRTINRIQEIEI